MSSMPSPPPAASPAPPEPTVHTGGDDPASVTDASGTIARFEMAYNLASLDRVRFGPPWRQRVLSILFLGFAVGMVAAVLYGQSATSENSLSRWLINQDRGRPIGSLGLSIIVFVCALGTVGRAQMRGIVVRTDGVEARYLLALGVPRIRRWTWAQVERVVVDDTSVMLELWNGEYERMPDVRNHAALCDLLEHIASGRNIVVTRLPPFEPGAA